MPRIILSIYAVVALATLVGWTQAATITVCPNGCEYSNLQAAIDSASPGDTIDVQGGIYCDPMIGTKKISLKRSGGIIRTPCTGTEALDWENLKNPHPPKLQYSDDFSNCQIRYTTIGNDPNIYCRDGKLNLVVPNSETNKFVIDPTNITLKNFILEVEATQAAGPDDNDYGVILRRVDDNNFYRFKISGTGYYGFDEMKDGQWFNLAPLKKSTAIHTGNATNLIKAECNGYEFTFYVNGVKLENFNNVLFKSGKAGLIAGTRSIGGVHITFDNLKIWAI